MDLDLNQEPLDEPQDSVLGLDVILTDLEIAHGRIEERIRQLEAVTTRARNRQRWRETSTPLQAVDTDRTDIGQTEKSSKLNGSQLVAKALEMNSDSKPPGSKSGGFFDCNVCLYVAKDPILTRCGHLFCWSCFYQLSYVHSNAKECPECLGEVTDTSIIPIYGNTNHNYSHNSKAKESGLRVPPRPHARRIESIRQKTLNRGAPSPPIEERIQQMGDQSLSRDLNSIGSSSTSRREGSDRRSLRVSRILLQGAASFSSLSSALNSAMDSAERLVEDLETYINNYRLRRSHQHPLHESDSLSNLERATESVINSVFLERQASDYAEIPRVSDEDPEHSRDSRRRRLR